MPAYTITPEFIEFAGKNKQFIRNILYPFFPENSKKICIDQDEEILSKYFEIVKNDKDLSDWYQNLTRYKESNLSKVNIKNSELDILSLNICINSIDKLLITENRELFNKYQDKINTHQITLLDKEIAKIYLNYESIAIKSSFTDITIENVFEVVKEICYHFQDLVENKGSFKLLVDKIGTRVPETKAQQVFYIAAYSHCKANNLKLCPEVNSGNGCIDFNLSKGFFSNVNVEMKFADHQNLEHGYSTQLPIYNRAENSKRSVFLIIKTNNDFDANIEKMLERIEEQKKSLKKNEYLPEVIVIDSTFKESASVRK